MKTNDFKAKYIGEIETMHLRKNKVYDVHVPTDAEDLLSVKDSDNEYYGYPKIYFEIIKE